MVYNQWLKLLSIKNSGRNICHHFFHSSSGATKLILSDIIVWDTIIFGAWDTASRTELTSIAMNDNDDSHKS